MALIVNENTYVTLVEAEAYVVKYFLSTNEKRLAWNTFADTDKEVLLLNSSRQIESINFIGKKTDEDQVMAFPRSIYSNGDKSWDVDTVVPDNIKDAQSEQAIQLAFDDGEEFSEREQLQQEGLKSFRIGHLSETYVTKITATGIKSLKAMSLLVPYIGGGYSVN